MPAALMSEVDVAWALLGATTGDLNGPGQVANRANRANRAGKQGMVRQPGCAMAVCATVRTGEPCNLLVGAQPREVL